MHSLGNLFVVDAVGLRDLRDKFGQVVEVSVGGLRGLFTRLKDLNLVH